MSEPQPLPLWFIPFFPLLLVGVALIIGSSRSSGGASCAAVSRAERDRARPRPTFGMASMDCGADGFPFP